MEKIAGLINLNYHNLLDEPESVEYIILRNRHFFTPEKRHNIATLSRLGWLLCKHNNRGEQ